jgi:formate C-acetyltransferase
MDAKVTESKIEPQVLDAIDSIQLSNRLKGLRDRYFSEIPTACGERVQLAMESWEETHGQDIELRRAEMLKKTAENIPVVIFDGEQTAGSVTRFFRGAYPGIDWDSGYLKDPRMIRKKVEGSEITFASPALKGSMTDDVLKICNRAEASFKGQTPAERMRQVAENVFGEWYRDVIQLKASVPAYEELPMMKGVLNWEKLINSGLRSIILEAENKIKQFKEMAEDDLEKLYFWQSAVMACEAAIRLSQRYAELARKLAASEHDNTRRQELEKIAEMCDWVPENPARSFQEALQAIRLACVCSAYEGYGSSGNGFLGRADQYLYPYFEKDMEEGRITLDEAAGLIGELIGFVGRAENIHQANRKEFSQNTSISHIVLGGITHDGQDACNELTYLFLHVTGLVRYAEPHFTLRWYPGITPRRFLVKGLETNRRVPGNPMFVNDKHMIQRIIDWGVHPDFAWDWAMQGCSQVTARPQRGVYHPWHFNIPLCLDLALHNGVSPINGKRVGPATGDPCSFRTFEEVYEAFKKQNEFLLKRLMYLQRLLHQEEVMHLRYPFQSALNENCIELGKDEVVGGCGDYPLWVHKDRGLVDVADSLTAIKSLVFEDKKITMRELIAAIDSNFGGEGGERVRQMCLQAPKFGNDIDEADDMVRGVGKYSAGVIRSENNPFGQKYGVNRNGLAWHYAASSGIGALPNGRKRGEPLCDGAISPMQGIDTKGPTAVAKSVLKADFTDAALAVLNQKFSSAFVKSPESIEKMALYTEALLGNGATHVQYNFLDKKLLLEAQKHPEQYKDLIVRVAGYCAYFVNLTREVQDDIIRRSEQEL